MHIFAPPSQVVLPNKALRTAPPGPSAGGPALTMRAPLSQPQGQETRRETRRKAPRPTDRTNHMSVQVSMMCL